MCEALGEETMAHHPGLLTAEEFAALPDPDGMRLELVRGRALARPLAFGDQGIAAGRLGALLGADVEQRRLGTMFAATGFLLGRGPDTVRTPALAFIRFSRVIGDVIGPWYVPIAPDLAVEVISSAEVGGYIDEKVRMWLDAGVRLVWAVYPTRREVVAHRPGRPASTLTLSDAVDGGDVVPGFSCPVAQIFGVKTD